MDENQYQQPYVPGQQYYQQPNAPAQYPSAPEQPYAPAPAQYPSAPEQPYAPAPAQYPSAPEQPYAPAPGQYYQQPIPVAPAANQPRSPMMPQYQQTIPPEPTMPPLPYNQQMATPQPQPYYQQVPVPQPIYTQTAPPQKKKKTGLIVGLSIGAVLLVIIIGGGIFFALQALNNNDDPPGISQGPGQTTDPGNTGPGTTDPVITGTPYTNSQMGISFTLAKGWEAYESSSMPSEVMDIFSEDDGTYIWIDRWPEESVKTFNADKTEWLKEYSFDSSAAQIKIVSETEIKRDGLTWQKIDFEVTDPKKPENDHYITIFITDMPNKRGLFMFAVITPLKKTGQTDSPYYKEGIWMFESLKFTK